MLSWPPQQARSLETLLREHRHKQPARYAVFDADHTIWNQDLEESLLPHLENQGIITQDRMDPSLRLIPFKEDESLYSYYCRLCEIDDKIGYPWIAQVFAGRTLGELKKDVDQLFALGQAPILTGRWDESKQRMVQIQVVPARIYPCQREYIQALHRNGIEVYVVTAALEELVRMVVSDSKYGLDIDPENVIGATCLLKDRATGAVSTARQQIATEHFWDVTYTEDHHRSLELTPYLWTPATWYIGKLSAIKEYIHPVRQPISVAGDSPNDHWMLFYSNVDQGGVRIWVDRSAHHTAAMHDAIRLRNQQLREESQIPTADRNWIFMTPDQLRSST